MIGTTLTHFQVLEKLGEGGMGVVYKARDLTLDRSVALKLLSTLSQSDSVEIARFLQEAKAISSLNHPNIATVHSLEDHQGQKFIVMEYLDGGTLKDVIRKGELPIDVALDYAIQIADGLSHAHKQDIVHRDLKTENIMLDVNGNLKITDFGLAKLKGKTKLTKTGSTIGTAAYMSPEQARGEDVDRRSDIFSLGVILYELLAGTLPFKGEHEAALMYEIVYEKPKLIHTVRQGVPDRLEIILDKILAKDARDRYQNAEELLEDLRRLSETLRLGGKEIFPWIRIAGIRRQAKWVIPVGSFFVLLLLFVVFYPGSAPDERIRIAVLPLEVEGTLSAEDAWLPDGICRSITNKLTGLNNLTVTPWLSSQRYRDHSMTLQQIADTLGVRMVLTGLLRLNGNRLFTSMELIDPKKNEMVWADEFDGSKSEIFDVQTNIALGAAEGLKIGLSNQAINQIAMPPARTLDAYGYYIRGSMELQKETPEGNDLALAYFNKAIELDSGMVDAYVGRGAVHGNSYFYGLGGRESLEEAERNYQHAVTLNPYSTDARRGLILVYYEIGSSEDCLKQGDIFPKDSLEDGGILSVRAEAYVLGGLAEKAVPLYRKILEIDRGDASAQWHLVLSLAWAGLYDEALDAGDVYFTRFGEDAEVHTWVGFSYVLLGDLDAAQVHYQRAMELFGDYPTDYVYLFAARVLRLSGDSSRADSILTTMIARGENQRRLSPSNTRVSAFLLAGYLLLNRQTEADQLYSKIDWQQNTGDWFVAGLMYSINKKDSALINHTLRKMIDAGGDFTGGISSLIRIGLVNIDEKLEEAPYFADRSLLKELKMVHQRYLDSY